MSLCESNQYRVDDNAPRFRMLCWTTHEFCNINPSLGTAGDEKPIPITKNSYPQIDRLIFIQKTADYTCIQDQRTEKSMNKSALFKTG